MSLEQAAALLDERKKRQSLDRGLSAGRAAYEGRAPQRSGIGDVPVAQVRSSVESALQQAAAQRQALADAATKQSLGQYTNTGTSAAAYDYLRGRGTYPVNPVLAGQPGSAITSPTVQRPYEQATRPGTPTQTQTSKTAKEEPSKMPTVSRGAMQMPQQGPLGQLLDLALPGYLGYKAYGYLTNPFSDGYTYDAISKYFGSPAAAATTSDAGVQALLDSAHSGPSAVIADATPGSGLEYLADAGAGAGAAGALPELGAGQVGYVWDGTTGSMIPATAEQIAEASSAGQWTGGVDQIVRGEEITANALNSGEISSLSEMAGWAPWLAAGAFAISEPGQQAINNIASGISDVVGGIGQPIAEGIGDIISSPVEEFGDFISSIFGWAEGGQVGGLSAAAQRFDDGGTTNDNPLIPKFTATNALGRMLDNDLTTQYQKAVETGNKSKARALKTEIDYRNRMRTVQSTPMAAGGISEARYNLGGYSDGGRLLKGPGDGVSDSIPATIGAKKQPARLADGEFVVPARIVSELGNGSTEAGARKLYAMMDRIQSARKKSVGKGKVAVNSRAEKYLPK